MLPILGYSICGGRFAPLDVLLGHVIDLDRDRRPAAEERLAVQNAERLDVDADNLLGLQRLADFEVIFHPFFIDQRGDLLRIDDVDVLDVGLQAFADSFGQGPGRARNC